MVKSRQNQSFCRVEQNGYLYSKILLSRGCRQGDPLTSYIFVICSEILAQVVRGCEEVKGIEILGKEFQLSQYADDASSFLNGHVNILNKLKHILKWFHKVSGLGINKGNIKVVKIGALRDIGNPWESKYGFEWKCSFDILGTLMIWVTYHRPNH